MTAPKPRGRWVFALMFWVLAFAVVALGLRALLFLTLPWLGFAGPEALWDWIDAHAPFSALFVRLIVFGSIHALIIRAARRRLTARFGRAARGLRRVIDALSARADAHRGAMAFLLALSTVVFVPFVLQPTLVPWDLGVRAWAERAANLTDGTASAAVLESTFGIYHLSVDRPVAGPGVAPAAVATASGPVLDRWDPLVRAVTGGDAEGFARLKAFMAVESGGRQFAVSPTGCAGLMQFCVGTARAEPFRGIFGVGRVFPCRPGRVAPEIARALESGDRARIEAQAASFRCALGDARFDPERSLRAGWRYLELLDAQVGGNLELMYVGYNSGPSVATALFAQLGAGATPAQIAAKLPAALRRGYGRAAAARAASLTTDTLPQLRAAYLRFRGR